MANNIYGNIKRLEKTIAEMEKRLEDRTFYGKISEYRCDLYYKKEHLKELKGA